MLYLKHEQECCISIDELVAPKVLDGDKAQTASALNALKNDLSYDLPGEKKIG